MTRLAIVWCCSRERGCHFTVNRFRSKTVNFHQADTWWLLNLEEIRVCEAMSAVLHCSLMQRCTHVLYWWHPHTLLHAHAHTNSDTRARTHTSARTHRVSRCTNRRNHIDIPPASWALVTPPWLSLIVWIWDEYTIEHTLKETHTYTVAQIKPPAQTRSSLG